MEHAPTICWLKKHTSCPIDFKTSFLSMLEPQHIQN